MKKIALLMEGWDKCFTYAWPSGIMSRIHELGLDANLYIYNCNANICDDDAISVGKRNIFRLPNFKDFDGVIFELNNTKDKSIVDEVVGRIRQSGVPAVAINGEFDCLSSVCVDNYRAYMNVLNHLFYTHACKHYWFITGPSDNYESSVRLMAVKDFIKEKCLSRTDYAFYEGDFGAESGRSAWRALRASYGTLPDAVVCVNDNVAVGVISEAELENYSVPENFLVTGFDNMDKARFFTPRITSVGVVREKLGVMALDTLVDLWNKKPVQAVAMLEPDNVYWDSYGCMPILLDARKTIASDAAMHMKNQILYGIEQEEHRRHDAALRYKLQQCETFEQLLTEIGNWTALWRCDSIDIVLQPEYCIFENFEDDDLPLCIGQVNGYLKLDCYRRVGYPDDMEVCYNYNGAKSAVNCRRTITGLFPYFDRSESGKTVLFEPISFRDEPIGYVAIEGAEYLMEKQYIFDVIEAIVCALDVVHMKTKMRLMGSATWN